MYIDLRQYSVFSMNIEVESSVINTTFSDTTLQLDTFICMCNTYILYMQIYELIEMFIPKLDLLTTYTTQFIKSF